MRFLYHRALGRSTRRIAISNHRILSFEHGRVAFRYRDTADDRKQKIMRLEALEFIRRFLLHVLPRGFVRIRHYGLLANRTRKEKIARWRGAVAGRAVLLRLRSLDPHRPRKGLRLRSNPQARTHEPAASFNASYG